MVAIYPTRTDAGRAVAFEVIESVESASAKGVPATALVFLNIEHEDFVLVVNNDGDVFCAPSLTHIDEQSRHPGSLEISRWNKTLLLEYS